MEFLKGVTGLYFLIGVLVVAAVVEHLIPWRRGVKINPARWARNVSMTVYGMILIGLIPFLSGVGAALYSEAQGAGLFNQISVALWIQVVAAIFIFDLSDYTVHRFLHKWYFLWRTHRTHHGDVHFDVSTSLRFHPIETFVRAIFDVIVVFLLGIPPEAIIVQFAIHAVVNTYGHMNATLPPVIDRLATLVFVTPHYHRLHHSAAPENLDSNFGTVFTIWDRLFGTHQPVDRLRKDEVFGIEGPEAIEVDSFANLALDPLRKPAGAAIPKPAPAHHD